jgi:hypothetical protein
LEAQATVVASEGPAGLEVPAASEVWEVVPAGLEVPVASEVQTALATAAWVAAIPWVIAVALEAGQEVTAVGPHAPAAAVGLSAWEGVVEAAEEVLAVAVVAVAAAAAADEGGNDHESHNKYEIIAL